MNEFDSILRLLLAAFLGLGLGVERRLRGNIAGTRTFALLATGSAGFTMSIADPTARGHVIAGIVTGVGFIGAGTLLRESGDEVFGTATAASVWAAAAIGVLAGAGRPWTACVVALLALAILEMPALSSVRRIAERLGLTVLDSDPAPSSPEGRRDAGK